MKADCLAVINGQNKTLWVRSATVSAEDGAKSLAAIGEHIPDPSLALIKSYVDSVGDEVFVELMTPWAVAYLKALAAGSAVPAKAVIEIWHANKPLFGLDGLHDRYARSEFTRCADVLTVDSGAEPEVALDQAYASSQTIDLPWRPGNPCRSSSVGDIFVYRTAETSQAYVVASLGFQPVAFD